MYAQMDRIECRRTSIQIPTNDARTSPAKGRNGKRSYKAYQASLIDNRSLRYSRTELQCFLWNENENRNTWTVVTLFCRSEQLTKILPVLRLDIENALSVLPRSVVSFLARHIPVWINDSYKVGPRHNPIYYQHCTTHHAKEWLIGMRDIPEKAPGIEIYNIDHYLQARTYYNGYGLLLHEYCHILHQFVLPDGLNNVIVQTLHRKALLYKAQYQSVYRRDWLLCRNFDAGTDAATRKDMAYALINHHEYFAELSVAYLCNGYQHLDCLSSEQTNVVKCWDLGCWATKTMDIHCWCPPVLPTPSIQSSAELVNEDTRSEFSKEKGRTRKGIHQTWVTDIISYMLDTVTTTTTTNRIHSPTAECQRLWHCGNFYPFTSRQLKRFDFEAFQELDKLWRNDIENWRAPK